MNSNCHTPFFIWFTGRTGSTLLCDLLESHPQIYCRMEDFSEIVIRDVAPGDDATKLYEFNGLKYQRKIYGPDETIENPSPAQTLEYLQQIYSHDKSACGFKFKYPTQAAVYPEVVGQLKKTPGLKVIELIRENVLKQSISLRNVERIRKLEAQKSCNLTTQVDLQPLNADIEKVVGHAHYFLNIRDEFHAMAGQFTDVLPVTYEQITSDVQATMNRITEFLNVDSDVELKTQFIKTTPDRIADAIANYEELSAAVAGTRLEAFLD